MVFVEPNGALFEALFSGEGLLGITTKSIKPVLQGFAVSLFGHGGNDVGCERTIDFGFSLLIAFAAAVVGFLMQLSARGELRLLALVGSVVGAVAGHYFAL